MVDDTHTHTFIAAITYAITAHRFLFILPFSRFFFTQSETWREDHLFPSSDRLFMRNWSHLFAAEKKSKNLEKKHRYVCEEMLFVDKGARVESRFHTSVRSEVGGEEEKKITVGSLFHSGNEISPIGWLHFF